MAFRLTFPAKAVTTSVIIHSKSTNHHQQVQSDSLTTPPPLCQPIGNQSPKNVKSPRLPPPVTEKRLSVWRSEYDFRTKKNQGGPV